jgi:hypothetical protein
MLTAPTEHGHKISIMSVYGKLMEELHPNNHSKMRAQICMFPCSSIKDPCIAVPYKTDESIMGATEWLVFKNQKHWYQIFMEYVHKSNMESVP